MLVTVLLLPAASSSFCFFILACKCEVGHPINGILKNINKNLWSAIFPAAFFHLVHKILGDAVFDYFMHSFL
jgi:hypothetical protein